MLGRRRYLLELHVLLLEVGIGEVEQAALLHHTRHRPLEQLAGLAGGEGVKVLHCRLQTADCRLQTADCRLQTADCRLHTAHCTLHTALCRLQTADCRLQTADCTPQRTWSRKSLLLSTSPLSCRVLLDS